MPEARIGIIGGSGLYEMEGLADVEEVSLTTPFGPPSDAIITGTLDGVRLAFLPRHGRGHRISPTELPARANIYALKSLGVERVISISAVGSLREEMKPLDFVVPDQLIDRTRNRIDSFFGDGGIVAHVSFADPFCPDLSAALVQAAREQGTRTHQEGTYLVIEGPQFSTKAESRLYRSWGASIIGMTALPEAKLAREAEMCYATLAAVTDYDVWHESEDPVSVELVVANLLRNVENAKKVIKNLVPRLKVNRECPCKDALKGAIITSRERIAVEARERLDLIIGKYMD